MKTLKTIDMPSEFIDLAGQWHSGQSDMIYAVCSTGGLTLGTSRPYSVDEERPMTDQEWHVHLWNALDCDVRHARKLAEKSSHEDAEALRRFEAFCEETADNLRSEYGIE